MLLHISEVLEEQYELLLFPDVAWNGISPRALTRGHLGFIFKARGGGARVRFLDPRQVDALPCRSQRLNRKSRTAPTLLPLR